MKKKKKKTTGVIRIPQGKEIEKMTEGIFKAIMVKNFQNLGREMNIQKHDAQSTQNRMNPNKATQGHSILSEVKDEEKILRTEREERSYIQGNPHKTTGRFLNRNLSGQ